MISFIIYCSNCIYISRVISDLIDNTDNKLIKHIIICNDGGSTIDIKNAIILDTNSVGRPISWNKAIELVSDDIIIFLRQPIKFESDWVYPIIDTINNHPNSIVGPSVHQLDINLWETIAKKWYKYGLQWDLSISNRRITNVLDKEYSPIVTSYCLAISYKRFIEIGMFDDGIIDCGEDIEICIRNWMFGGEVILCDGYVSAAIDINTTVNGLARIAEIWFPKYSTFFYQSRRLDPKNVKIGRVDRIEELKKNKQVRTIEWWLEHIQPELLSIISLKDTRTGRSAAVVGSGPTLDYIEPSLIEKHDVIIGIDYAGMEFSCDYVITDSVNIATMLATKYSADRFILPYAIIDRTTGEYIPAGKIIPGSTQFDQTEIGVSPDSVNPPFMDYGSIVHVAVQFALFLGPRSVMLFGCDNRLVDGKSHSAKCGYYGDGIILPDSDNTRKKFMLFETGLHQLGEIACSIGVPLLRVGHL